jgi:hypothetical protein
MSLFDPNWMEKSAIIGTINKAEDRVYFSTIEGFGHFVLSANIPNGDLSAAEIITAGPSLIGSMELSGDELSILLGDVDAKTVVRVTLGEPGSEEFFGTHGKPFYPGWCLPWSNMSSLFKKEFLYKVIAFSLCLGPMSALDESDMIVVNTMAKSLEVIDVSTLSEATCGNQCQFGLSNPLDVVVDREGQMVYVLDANDHPALPTYKFTIKSINLADIVSTDGGNRAGAGKDFSNYMKYYMQWLYLKNRGN